MLVTLLVLVASMELNTVVIAAQKIIISIITCVLTLAQKDFMLTTLLELVIHVTTHVLVVLNLLDNVVDVKKDSSYISPITYV